MFKPTSVVKAVGLYTHHNHLHEWSCTVPSTLGSWRCCSLL